eukprot:CAMPEP_0172523684 /NCGR_PEP_ID=MMETSP1066-20121228/293790_1 /TAXON_ID=671091 /ORGANISM="Coscinodiscus wailesii, Strain CCMP2513" /LENGTH=203 /DNA_ID=CAMNT_0013306769 /DNA_START=408 /DNA_END=1019 /DNA_ORIENTATION=-
MDLMKGATRETLIIYVHREETSRMISGIKEVLSSRVCQRDERKGMGVPKLQVTTNETHCVINEGAELFKLIQKKRHEMAFGATETLTCQFYESLKENRPNMIFMNYKQSSALQNALAKHYCPGSLAVKKNVDADKKADRLLVYIHLENEIKEVSLETWLEEKQHMIEWALGLKDKASCQGLTRKMEDDLLACDDEVMSVIDFL